MVEIWYLASPYSATSAALRRLRFDAVALVAARLVVEKEIFTFCAISHTHPISEHMVGLDMTNPTFWLKWHEPLEKLCTGLLVCKLPGWEDSTGIGIERDNFAAAGKPIKFVHSRGYFSEAQWAALGGRAYNEEV